MFIGEKKTFGINVTNLTMAKCLFFQQKVHSCNFCLIYLIKHHELYMNDVIYLIICRMKNAYFQGVKHC